MSDSCCMSAIGFSRDSSFKSKLIRWITRSRVSHVFIRYDSSLWGDVVVHATSRGIVIEPYEWVIEEKEIELFKIDHNMGPGFSFIRDYLTAEYDFFSVIWNSLLYVLFWFTGARFLWKLVTRNSSKFSCSEAAVLWLQGAGFPGSFELDAELTYPGMLLEFIEKSEYSKHMLQLRENGL